VANMDGGFSEDGGLPLEHSVFTLDGGGGGSGGGGAFGDRHNGHATPQQERGQPEAEDTPGPVGAYRRMPLEPGVS